jgi:hypothetical protein
MDATRSLSERKQKATLALWRLMTNWSDKFIATWRALLTRSPRDIVMGCATGYKITAVRPFVESLISYGRFEGEIVLFIKPSDQELAAYLRSRNIIAVSLSEKNYPISNIHMSRYFAYLDYLRQQTARGKRYRYILLSDVRDVVFQKALFGLPCADLELHYEAMPPAIGDEPWNTGWIRREFGEEVLAILTGKRISCSGTVTGQLHGIVDYLEKIQSIMLGLPEDIRSGSGGDQAVHNYLLHYNFLPYAKVLDNFERVATLHFVGGSDLGLSAEGHVVNPDGSISEIAHQWDRHPHLSNVINAKYAARAEGAK